MKKFNNILKIIFAFALAFAFVSMTCKTGNIAWSVPAVISMLSALFFVCTHGNIKTHNAS